jgi:hypothetical protein
VARTRPARRRPPSSVSCAQRTRRSSAQGARTTRPRATRRSTSRVTPLWLRRTDRASSLMRSRWSGAR